MDGVIEESIEADLATNSCSFETTNSDIANLLGTAAESTAPLKGFSVVE